MMAGITNKGPLGVCAPWSPHGGLSRELTKRRLADACARAAVGARRADRVRGRARLPDRNLEWADRLPGPPARNRLLQRLCGRHLCARRQSGCTIRSAAAACARTDRLRRENAILRLALSAILPWRRGGARAHAVSARAHRVA